MFSCPPKFTSILFEEKTWKQGYSTACSCSLTLRPDSDCPMLHVQHDIVKPGVAWGQSRLLHSYYLKGLNQSAMTFIKKLMFVD